MGFLSTISAGALALAALPDGAGLSGDVGHDGAPPNVLLLISDDLAAGALGCYGNAQCETPNIDRLAARGLRFENAYCQYPVCGPSRASLMSGMYPGALQVLGNGGSNRFDEQMGERPTLGEHLIANGYTSTRVGKIYHMLVPGNLTAGVSGPDHADSWSEFFNCPGPEWMTAGEHAMLSNERLKRDPEKHYGLGFGTAFYVVEAAEDAARQPDALAADKALELLRDRGEAPFFLAVGMVRPHVPLVAPAEYFARYDADELTLPPSMENDWADLPKRGISGYNSRRRGLEDAARQREVLRAYYAAVSFMDAQVGRVLDALDELDLTDDTLVVFTSDHGYHLGEHEFWQKLSLHEESARVPLILAGPGVPAGETTSLAELVDLYPTLAELAGLELPEHLQGESLAPVVADPSAAVRAAATTRRGKDRLLRTPDWAYMEYDEGGAELYDMRADPLQFTNLVEDPAYATVRAELAAALRARAAEIVGE